MALDLSSKSLLDAVRKNEIGIEKECLRVTSDGRLAHTPHPFSESDKNIGRDFCENQIEFISDVHTDSAELVRHLNELHSRVFSKISEKDELLWSFSNPPYVTGENDIPIAKFSDKSKEIYRNYLSEKYGKMKMLFSGIHYNFSFSPELLEATQADKDALYLDLAQKLLKYSWLIVYLTAASPLLDSSYIKNTALTENDKYRYSSVRCGEAGYWNDFIPVLSYNSIKEYTESIQRYIDIGLLRNSSELYYPIRLKPRGENSLENLSNGVNHIELRMLDVNPFSRVGIIREDIDFIHLLILWLCSLDEVSLSASEQISAVKNIKTSALYDDSSNQIHLDGNSESTKDAALRALNLIKDFAEKKLPEYLGVIDYQLQKPDGNRYAELVRGRYGADFFGLGLKLAEQYARGDDYNV